LSLLRHATLLPCLLTRCKAGINIAISSAMMAITTRSSIRVKALRFFMTMLQSVMRQNKLPYNVYNLFEGVNQRKIRVILLDDTVARLV
jgi:hypothetical protein